MEIVLQGPLDEYAIELAHHYLDCEFVEKVIISCWQNNMSFESRCSEIQVCRSPDLENPGIGNRNRQIISSAVGLRHVKSRLSAKMRTDQKISISSLHMMMDFFEKFKSNGYVFVTSLFRNYPFHPRDHVFWGYTEDLIKVFDIPLCPIVSPTTVVEADYVKFTRAETYIGSYYYARFNYDIEEYIANPLEFLVDNAPQREKAMAKYRTAGEVFKPFPPIQMQWPKRGLRFYPYYGFNPHGEFWDETPWRFNG